VSSERQELIRRFAVAIVQGEHANTESDFSIAGIWHIATELADAEPPQPPADDRIERALELLREAFRQRADTHGRCEGWEMVSEAVQILEGDVNG
jgi:hypothetical protein